MNLLILILLSALGTTHRPRGVDVHGKEQSTIVKGLVTDPNNSLVGGATIIFTRVDQHPIVITSSITADDGSYSIALEPGTYELSARRTGFCVERRASIRLHENLEVRIDFQLPVCAYVHPVRIPIPETSTKPFKLPGAAGGYGEEELSAISSTGLRPLILFGGREQRTGSIVYHGLAYGGNELLPVFTYNLTTLRSDILIYNSKDGSIEGIGNATWQDTKNTWQGKRIRLSIEGEHPKVLLSE